jgi:hypothetical protein
MTQAGSRSIAIAIAGVLLGSSVGLATEELPAGGPDFGDYQLVPLLDDAQPYDGPATPDSLADVRVSALVDDQLTRADRARLAEQGLVIVPAQLRLFHEAYGDQYGTGTPVFVTTDAAFHTWHLVFDKTLREVEQTRLLPALEELVDGMRTNAMKQRRELAGTALADDAARVNDLLAVAAAELGIPAGTLSRRAKAERRSSTSTSSPPRHPSWARSPTTRCSRREATTRATPT